MENDIHPAEVSFSECAEHDHVSGVGIPLQSASLNFHGSIETLSFKIFSCLSGAPAQSSKTILATPKISRENRRSGKHRKFYKIEKKGLPQGETRVGSSFGDKPHCGAALEMIDIDGSVLALQPKEDLPKKALKGIAPLACTALADAIGARAEFPWELTHKIHDPLLLELLIDLDDCLHSPACGISDTTAQAIFEYASRLARKKSARASEIIGNLIFVLDSNPGGLNETFTKTAPDDLPSWLKEQLSSKISTINHELLGLQASAGKSGIHHPERTIKTKLPIRIAQLIVSNRGRINVGILPQIVETFLKNKEQPINYEINIAYVLHMLSTRPELRYKLTHLMPSPAKTAPSNVVVRTTLDLFPDDPISAVAVRRTAVSALLSHLRQGSDGSCFATPLAIELLTSHLDRVIDDFDSLLKTNKLTRTVQKRTQDFPFLLHIGEQSLEKEVECTREGRLLGDPAEKAFIFDAPCIAAACRQMGIMDPKQAVLKALAEDSTAPSLKLSMKLLLQKLALYASKEEGRGPPGLLYLHGCFAFQSQECNPLLQVWENAIASMAEAEEGGMVRSAIINCVVKTLKGFLEPKFTEFESLTKTVLKHLKSDLMERIHLQYDPHITGKETADDQKSNEGAFILYDRGNHAKTDQWKRIDSPSLFQEFTAALIDQSLGWIKKNGKHFSKQERAWIQKTLEQLQNDVCGDKFLQRCLKEYYYKTENVEALLKEPESIKYAPWITKTGNSFSNVLRVYLERFPMGKNDQFCPLTTRSLLSKVVEIGKNAYEMEESLTRENPNFLLPIRVPGIHAFSLMLGHPTLAEAWKGGLDAELWIDKTVLIPGIQIAESMVEKGTRQKMTQHCLEELISPENKERFLKRKKLIPKNLSIKEWRLRLLEEILHIEKGYWPNVTDLALRIDTLLAASLPPDAAKKLHKSVVHFADTNWADGLNDIHFCFLVNPGSGNLEIWVVSDNQQQLLAIDQNLWIKSKEWEFFTDFLNR